MPDVSNNLAVIWSTKNFQTLTNIQGHARITKVGNGEKTRVVPQLRWAETVSVETIFCRVILLLTYTFMWSGPGVYMYGFADIPPHAWPARWGSQEYVSDFSWRLWRASFVVYWHMVPWVGAATVVILSHISRHYWKACHLSAWHELRTLQYLRLIQCGLRT